MQTMFAILSMINKLGKYGEIVWLLLLLFIYFYFLLYPPGMSCLKMFKCFLKVRVNDRVKLKLALYTIHYKQYRCCGVCVCVIISFRNYFHTSKKIDEKKKLLIAKMTSAVLKYTMHVRMCVFVKM